MRMVNAVNPGHNSHMQLLAAALSHIQNLRLRSVLRQQTTVKTHSPAKKISPSGYSNLGAGGAEGVLLANCRFWDLTDIFRAVLLITQQRLQIP